MNLISVTAANVELYFWYCSLVQVVQVSERCELQACVSFGNL